MDSFEVENFRSLKHLKLEKLARVNLLVGKNNSGKTSVLEALFAVLGVGGPYGFTTLEHERKIDKGDFRQLFYGFNARNLITIEAIYREDDSIVPIEESLLKISINALENYNNVRNGPASIAGRSSPIKEIELTTSFHDNLSSLRFLVSRSESGDLFSTPTPGEALKASQKQINFPAAARHATAEFLTTTIDRQILNNKIGAFKISKSLDSLLQTMQRVDKRIEAIELVDGEIYLDLGPSFSNLLLLNLMGEGIQRLLDISSAIINVSGGLVLIDEIDNGLHYSALRILWKGILQAARKFNVQVFATTHSAEALRHLTWVLDDDCKEYRDDVAAYTLIRAKDDTVRSYRYDYEQLDFAMEHDIEVRN